MFSGVVCPQPASCQRPKEKTEAATKKRMHVLRDRDFERGRDPWDALGANKSHSKTQACDYVRDGLLSPLPASATTKQKRNWLLLLQHLLLPLLLSLLLPLLLAKSFLEISTCKTEAPQRSLRAIDRSPCMWASEAVLLGERVLGGAWAGPVK